MKIIITESKSDKLIERLLDEHGMRLSFGLNTRYYTSPHSRVLFWFTKPNTDEYPILKAMDFDVENGVPTNPNLGITSLDEIIPEFKYIPIKVIEDYFKRRGMEYVDTLVKEDEHKN